MNRIVRGTLVLAGLALCASLLVAGDALAYKRKSSVGGQGGQAKSRPKSTTVTE